MTQAELKAFMQGVVVANGNSIVMAKPLDAENEPYITASPTLVANVCVFETVSAKYKGTYTVS